jgi:hypothetical protein
MLITCACDVFSVSSVGAPHFWPYVNVENKIIFDVLMITNIVVNFNYDYLVIY